jgi:hypothetical protein
MDEHAGAILVGQALDDIEAGRLELSTALRLLADYAWSAGYRACSDQHPSTRIPEPANRARSATSASRN